jgi:drug/metabolite transporter (DMT)-like permease
VLISWLQASLPALTFAGLRYALAFLCLMPFVLLNPLHRSAIRSFTRADWGRLAVLGIVYYTLTQGSQFLSLAYLPAAMVSLLLNLTPLVVGLFGIVFLREHPSSGQWLGIALTIIGVVLYFFLVNTAELHIFGLLVALGGVEQCSKPVIGGRLIARQTVRRLLLLLSAWNWLTLLLAMGITFQGSEHLICRGYHWLAIVNTAFAFTLWNPPAFIAVESSVITSR